MSGAAFGDGISLGALDLLLIAKVGDGVDFFEVHLVTTFLNRDLIRKRKDGPQDHLEQVPEFHHSLCHNLNLSAFDADFHVGPGRARTDAEFLVPRKMPLHEPMPATVPQAARRRPVSGCQADKRSR